MAHPGGRPKKYTSKFIEKMADKLLEYANSEDLPLEQDFSSKNGFSSQRISEWAKVSEKFSESLKIFKDIQRSKWIYASALNPDMRPAVGIFTLKNITKGTPDPMTDTMDLNHESSDGSMTPVTINITGK